MANSLVQYNTQISTQNFLLIRDQNQIGPRHAGRQSEKCLQAT